MGVFACMYVNCVHAIPMEARRGCQVISNWSYQRVVSPHIGSGHQTQVLWKSSKSSKPLTHLSSPNYYHYWLLVKSYYLVYKLYITIGMYEWKMMYYVFTNVWGQMAHVYKPAHVVAHMWRSALSCHHGFQVLDSGCLAYEVSAFTCWALSSAQNVVLIVGDTCLSFLVLGSNPGRSVC